MFAYLDDTYIVTTLERTGAVNARSPRNHSGIRIHGITEVWNSAGEKHLFCERTEIQEPAAGEGSRCPHEASRLWARFGVTAIALTHHVHKTGDAPDRGGQDSSF